MTPGAPGRWQAFGAAALLCLSACTAAIPEPGLPTRAEQRQAANPPPSGAYPPADYAAAPATAIQSAPLPQAYARPGDDLLGGPPIPPRPADFSTAPPPPAYAYAPPPPAYMPPPASAYAPPPPAYAPPPPAYAYVPPVVISSPAVPNPEDMTSDERLRVYGPSRAAARATGSAPRAARPARVARGAAAARPRRAAPRAATRASRSRPAQARPAAPRQAARPAPVRVAPSASTRAAPAPAAPAARSTPSPATTAKPAQRPAAAAPPVRPATPADRLGQAMVGPVAAGGRLTQAAPAVPDQPHTVTLALPTDLFSVLRREAARLGLARKARTADLAATLEGQNYEITPSGPQSLRLQPGKAPTFTWAVKPLRGATGQLSAKVEAILNGQGAPARLSLGRIDHGFSELADQAAIQGKSAASGLRVFDLPNVPPIAIPGLGVVRSGVIVAALIVLFLVILIIAMIRTAADRRRQRDIARRRRAAAQYVAAEQARAETRAAADEARTLENV